MKKVLLSVTLLFTLLLQMFVLPTAVMAEGNDISSSAVDSISFTNPQGTEAMNDVTIGSPFSVTVRFSEDDASGNQKPGFDIRSGDRIFVSWTSPEGVGFNPSTGTETLDLKQEGEDGTDTIIAQAVFTTSGVTITFNDNVNNLQHVKGRVTFLMRTSEVDGITYTNKENGTVTSGEITGTIAIKPYVEPSSFGAKSGWYQDDNTIRWMISFNRQYETDMSGDLVITDQLPISEEFAANLSFYYEYDYKDSEGKSQFDTLARKVDQFNARSGCSLTIDDNNYMTVTIPAADIEKYAANGKRGYILFYTKLKEGQERGVHVDNTSTIQYKDRNGTPISKEYTGHVATPNASGDVEGVPQGTIQVSKVVNGTTDPIEGVTFRVYQVVSETDRTRESGWYNGEDYVEITTDSAGIASVANLNDGHYEIEEIPDNLPNWISETSLPESVFVTLGGTAGTKVTIGNSVKTIDVTAVKEWVQADGLTADTDEHVAVYFKLYRSVGENAAEEAADAEIKAVITEQGESTGSVTWSDLPQYDNHGNEYSYSVKEVDEDGNDLTPVGYTKTEEGLKVTNTREKTDISGTKTWNDEENRDGKRPESIIINLLEDGNIKESVTVTEEDDWSWSFNNLPKYTSLGEEIVYTITENAVKDYTTTYDGYDVTNSYTPGKTSITVNKVWNDSNDKDGIRPSSVQVQLYADGEKVGDAVTLSAKNQWRYTWTELDEKANKVNIVYSVKEVTAIDGYTKVEGSVTNGNVTITNTHTPKPEPTPVPNKPVSAPKTEKPVVPNTSVINPD